MDILSKIVKVLWKLFLIILLGTFVFGTLGCTIYLILDSLGIVS